MGKLFTRRSITRLAQWGAVAVVFSFQVSARAEQLSVRKEDTTSSALVVEPVVSVAKNSAVESSSENLVEVVLSSQRRPLFQHATYPAAWKAAQKSNRPILVYVSMPNCHYCEKMKSQVYRLPRVRNLVSSSFETVRAGRYTHAKLVQNLHVKWYPTTVLVGPNNKILDVIEGYADANQFQQRLQTGLASANSTSTTTQTR